MSGECDAGLETENAASDLAFAPVACIGEVLFLFAASAFTFAFVSVSASVWVTVRRGSVAVGLKVDVR